MVILVKNAWFQIIENLINLKCTLIRHPSKVPLLLLWDNIPLSSERGTHNMIVSAPLRG